MVFCVCVSVCVGRNCVYESRCLAHSGQMMSASSVMKPRPTSDVLQLAQMKQSLCQWRSSNEMKRVPPMPATRRRQSRALSLTWVRAGNNEILAITGDWLCTWCASLGEQFAKAFGTVWFLLAAGEALARQRGRAVGAREALAMPRLVFVSYTSRCNYLNEFETGVERNRTRDGARSSPFCTWCSGSRTSPRSIRRSRSPGRAEWTTSFRSESCRRSKRSTSRATAGSCTPSSWCLNAKEKRTKNRINLPHSMRLAAIDKTV